MKYLSPEQILFIHARLIGETGGSHGLRDIGLLQSAVGRPTTTFEGEELYKSAFEKAAALMHSLVNNHPFVDGNKRVGITSAVIFLEINDIQLKAGNKELVEFTQSVVAGLENEQIAEWFKKHRG